MSSSSPAPNGDRQYNDLLGAALDAGADEIKRAFRRAAARHHPDKGGDDEAFKEIARAYHVLAGAVYDHSGEDAVNASAAAAGEPSYDEFVDTFTGDVVKFVDLSLEEFYHGVTKKFSVTRDVTCVNCHGEGNTIASPAACGECGGAGYKVAAEGRKKKTTMMMGFRRGGGGGRETCAACGGGGEVSEGMQRCTVCGGRKVATEKKVIELVVGRGAPDGHRITFAGEGDVTEKGIAGDVVMVLRQRNHAKFTRKGDDLFYQHELSLAEALCGFRFFLTHLDGRRLLFTSGAGAG
uniref:J domain-containing protein n=1 Tax=Leersia perrieri TaxID=77586 RepID=A0A0D9Y1J2_9ORYZ